ncbi:MAG TPA: cation:proton antiporter [Steroidobacteraceae bacterium]
MTSSLFLLQIATILTVSSIFGAILRFLRQPTVVGEIAAGVVLGPTVLGVLVPDVHVRLFNPAELTALKGIADLGLVLFMFVTGIELRQALAARKQVLAACWTGVLSFAVPFVLGIGVGCALYGALAPPQISMGEFSLFIGAALSVTALPVLARILEDLRLTTTTLGALSLAGASITDVLSWVAVLAVTTWVALGGDWSAFFKKLSLLLSCAAVLIAVLPPLLRRSSALANRSPSLRITLEMVLLVGALLAAQGCELIGAHAGFGALVFGVCVPGSVYASCPLMEYVRRVAIVVLMPVFFASLGLETSIDTLLTGAGIGALALILVVATVGKILGAGLGARLSGYDWTTAAGVGSLMNARGLMELVVIRIGLDTGVIGSSLFTILLGMAVFTTLLTGPMLMSLRRWNFASAPSQPAAAIVQHTGGFE